MGGTEGKQRWGGSSPEGRAGDEVEDDAAMREKFGDGHLQEESEKGSGGKVDLSFRPNGEAPSK